MTGILIVQLGTPDAPTATALRPYLRQFLSDPRVIEVPKWIWWPLLYGYILRTRPAASAAKYARIWNAETGSPLLHYTRRQTELLQQQFPNTPVRFGMMIGNPPVAQTIQTMLAEGVDRIIVFPMFPQYSATTTASAMDCLFAALHKLRHIPAIRIVPPYYDHPAYLDAVAATIRDDLARLDWQPEHLVISFHGIPVKYVERGDPYPQQVAGTMQGLAERLPFPREQWTTTYQSRFGRDPWLQPYTDDVLTGLAKRGVKKVAVALPGFTVDCLETLDEIGNESREVFQHAGGEQLRAIPCLNDHPDWIQAMATILRTEGQGWLPAEPPER
ncbi:MAG: ferrochelatase [Bacteroidales bacterium]|nr:ferrochelatase [Bacteroidales bacterium]